LLIDEADRVLLLRAAARAGGPQVWFAVGGGIEQGEDVLAAAVREVREETGLAGLPLGPEVWRRRHLLEVDGAMWDLRERWYLARVAGFVPARGGFTEWERARISDVRWWTVPDLVATDEQVAPAGLGALIEEVFRNGPPSRPLVIGT
jgi:8-oxo-dGTP pyrophosphatase MutT (NUDIX family)